jgi:predicted dehydrogenase
MKLNLGILSFAHGHIGAYAGVMKDQDDVNLVAAWDDDKERGQTRSREFEIEFVPALDDFLGRDDIQAVMIGSETSKHAEHVEVAAAAGKDILLQKPLAFTPEDCDRIIQAVEASGVRFSVAWQMRCDLQNQWMKEQLLSGRFGRPLMVRRRHGLPTQLWGDAFADSWHVKPEFNLGMFMDDASHPADWFLWMFGKPVSVMAEIDTLLNPKVPDDNGAAIFKFKDGMIGIIESSFTTIAAEDTTTIVAEKGTILQSWGDGPSCETQPESSDGPLYGLKYYLAGEDRWRTVDIPTPASHGARIHGVVEPAVSFLKGERGPIADAREGRISTEMVLAAYASSKEGRRIVLKD